MTKIYVKWETKKLDKHGSQFARSGEPLQGGKNGGEPRYGKEETKEDIQQTGTWTSDILQ